MTSENTLYFKTRARLLSQLGQQLIKSESVALVELVKNSYDADASHCSVSLKNLEDKENASIVIEDDGCGMNAQIVKDVWMEIGTAYKFEEKKQLRKTPLHHRNVLGEKGIGRFGVHRLGFDIEIVTRMENQNECVLKIDWKKIEESIYIEEFPVSLYERTPLVFEKGHGSRITITGLRDVWTRGRVRDIAREINSLSSPFISNESFRVDIKVDNDWLDGICSYDRIKDMAMFSFSMTLQGKEISDFSYDFKPYKLLKKVRPRHVSLEDIQGIRKLIDSEGHEINLSDRKIGTVKIEGNVFDLDSKILNLGLTGGIADLKGYLRQNGGVKVFRDNMRVWDYGESDNDWLDLDSRRINNPSKTLSNHLLLAAVYLDGIASSDLIEKSNREGFVENDSYSLFQKACRFSIELIQSLRNADKEKIREAYKKKSDDKKNVIDAIEDVRLLISENVKNEAFARSLNKKLDVVAENFVQTTEILMKSAGAGLNLVSVLHQLEKIIKNLKTNIKKKASERDIELDMDMLSDLISGYSVLTRNSKMQQRPIAALLNRAERNVKFRFLAHRIECVESDALKRDGLMGLFSDNLLMNVVMNIFDNSIWWLGYSGVEHPEIYLDAGLIDESYVYILIADNGPGFVLEKDVLTKPFITAKPAGLGMGIGLHLSKEILESMGGTIVFPEFQDVSIPAKYEKGAIVKLVLKRG